MMTSTRSKKLYLKVVFENGKEICYKNVLDTYLDVLKEIGMEQLQHVKLDVCYLPIFSKEIYPKYKDYMKPLCDGWYVNTQSDTRQKYMQLRSIKDQLNLNIEISIGVDLEATKKITAPKNKEIKYLLVKFPDGHFIGRQNKTDTFLEVIWDIGVDLLKKREIEFSGQKIVTPIKTYPGQIQVDKNAWLTVPISTKNKYKLLCIINSTLKLNLEITMI